MKGAGDDPLGIFRQLCACHLSILILMPSVAFAPIPCGKLGHSACFKGLAGLMSKFPFASLLSDFKLNRRLPCTDRAPDE